MKIAHTEDGTSIITGQLVLTNDTHATGIHGITGQETESGDLAAGTLVCNVREGVYCDAFGNSGIVTRYDASTDGGETWFAQKTYGRVETRYLSTEHMQRV